MSLYYGRDGMPLDRAGMVAAFEGNRTVAFTRISPADDPEEVVEVSTVHLVCNHQYGDDGPPLIFETMMFGDGDDDCERYSTEQQAREGHARMVARVAAGLSRPVVLNIDPDELHASRLADPDGETRDA